MSEKILFIILLMKVHSLLTDEMFPVFMLQTCYTLPLKGAE